MAVKVLALGVAVDANVWVEAYGLAAPAEVEEGESAMLKSSIGWINRRTTGPLWFHSPI